jgi:hypothetical protein
MAPPIPLYPPRPSVGFAKDPKLQRAVDTALAELAAARKGIIPFSLAIIDLAGSSNLGYGAYKPDEIDYVASAAKVAAMLAAFALRDLAQRFHGARKAAQIAAALDKGPAGLPELGNALAGGKPAGKVPGLFEALRAVMDDEIDKASPKPLMAVQRTHRIPHYEQVFTPVPPGGWLFPNFSGSYRNSMEAMIVPSDNAGAGRVIRGVGYGYLNGLLEHFGLFVPKTPAGIWLAGDFVSQYPYVRITSVNDAGVAQAGTALSMAQMMAMIVNRACIDTASCDEMRDLLAKAVSGVDQPFLSRDAVSDKLRIPLGKITHCKLGYGPLKKGGNVCSEVFRVEGLRKAGKAYAIAYQNLNENNSSLGDVAFMIQRALELYE